MKLKVAVIFGGRSAEHEVSLLSARNIISALDKNKYKIVLIGIDKKGHWYLEDQAHYLLNPDNPKLIGLARSGKELVLPPTPLARQNLSVDVAFPVLHGTYGEDGTIQGFLKMAGIPFVGAGVLGSAVGMDKEVQKRLLRDAGIPTARFVVLANPSPLAPSHFLSPLFVKPANLGSSVGVSKVYNQKELKRAIKEAFKYDTKVLIEEAVAGREIECAVLGNEKPVASLPGEVIPAGSHEFYDYDAKYFDENGATLQIPAKLSKEQVSKIQKISVKAFKALNCEGMARVDMFLKPDGKVLVNEINTIPGFTDISMYPKLWEVSGLPQTALLDRLIELAISRFDNERKLSISRN